MNDEFIKRIDLQNYDGTKINIPDYNTFLMLVEHTRKFYPELHQKHFGNSKNGRFAMPMSDIDDVPDISDAYVDFVGNLECAIILPDGSELVSPLKKVLPVGMQNPPTLDELLNGRLNYGDALRQFEAAQEEAYDEEHELNLFAEVIEHIKENPSWGNRLYDEVFLNRVHADLSNDSNTLEPRKDAGSVLDTGDGGLSQNDNGNNAKSDKDSTIE